MFRTCSRFVGVAVLADHVPVYPDLCKWVTCIMQTHTRGMPVQ